MSVRDRIVRDPICSSHPLALGERIMLSRRSIVLVAVLTVAAAGCGDDSEPSFATSPGPIAALIVVSPHPDDESIMGAATIHRLAAEPNRYVRAIYVSSGDKASVAGDCNGIPEARKTEMIITLRENETRAAWKVIAPDRDVPLDFVRGPDMGLVASSALVDGVRQDVLTSDGANAVDRVVHLATQLPPSVRTVLFMTAALYDGHPDHRTAYHAARSAAQLLRQRGLDVRIWSWIIHDENGDPSITACCPGDLHWPSAGAQDNYLTLINTTLRPRPPMWTHVEDVTDLVALRNSALSQHVSQVVGYPPLCMQVYIPRFYKRWNEKVEEPFYEEVL